MPNFGQDADIKDSLKNLKNSEDKYGKWDLPQEDLQVDSTLEREPLLSWAPKPKKGSHPVDYFVPNFGLDEDIATTHKNVAKAEGQLKHTWTPVQDKEDKWIVPTETADFKMIQTEAELNREPLLTWKPKPKKGHPVDYFVPNFGVDEDIAATIKNTDAAEKSLGHKWTPVQDEEDKWVVPTVTAEFKM